MLLRKSGVLNECRLPTPLLKFKLGRYLRAMDVAPGVSA